jgi:hypothetical protein
MVDSQIFDIIVENLTHNRMIVNPLDEYIEYVQEKNPNLHILRHNTIYSQKSLH